MYSITSRQIIAPTNYNMFRLFARNACFRSSLRVHQKAPAASSSQIPKAVESDSSSERNPLIHENGLYYGKFTPEEYERAKDYVTTQYRNLEKEIKGTQNVRENVGKMPQFPSPAPARQVASLSDLFKETIKTTGPLSLLAYMRQCLTHPQYGYYTTRDPLAREGGDFVTLPEISSVFGELIGIWLYTVWEAQGKLRDVSMVEFGPGRGTLMHDAMKVFTKFAGPDVNVRIVLVEASPVLRREQCKMLCGDVVVPETQADGFDAATSKWGGSVQWVDTEKDVVGSTCNYVLAHEFFDALPVKSFVRTPAGWRELLVEHTQAVVNTQKKLPGEVAEFEAEELELDFHLTAAATETPSLALPQLSERYRELPVGSRIEICADAELYMREIVKMVGQGPCGAALVIDYGLADAVPLNSVRGIHQHRFVSPFFRPGDVDLSVDVDFANLRALAEPHAAVFGPREQGKWLNAMGAGQRFDQLIRGANLIANKELLYELYMRLTSSEQMGLIYKFMAVLPAGQSEPAGFWAEQEEDS